MALLLKNIVLAYKYARDEMDDPRTRDWLLVKSPIPVMTIMILYLVVVFEWLPKFMEKRKPYNLQKVIIVYNFIQVLLCSYIVIKGAQSLHTLDIKCAAVDYSDDPHAMNFARLTWLYFMIKIFDLCDTVFFILRKKYNQVSFLHVYHHFGLMFIGWFGTKYIAGGESIWVGFINSLVHVVMYSYYMFMALWPEKRESILTWKRHVTQLQLAQFILLFINFVPKLFINCNYPKIPMLAVLPQILSMIVLFGDFYRRAYLIQRNNATSTVVKAN